MRRTVHKSSCVQGRNGLSLPCRPGSEEVLFGDIGMAQTWSRALRTPRTKALPRIARKPCPLLTMEWQPFDCTSMAKLVQAEGGWAASASGRASGVPGPARSKAQ